MKRGIATLILFACVIFFALPVTLAHTAEREAHTDKDTEKDEKIDLYLTETSTNYIIIAAIIVTLLIATSIYFKPKNEAIKAAIFSIICISVLASTSYLAFSTVYLNILSEAKGPVHWHADFEIYDCNKKIDILDPKGFSNRIGSSVFHEHGDNRIHVEGVVIDKRDVNLGNFFATIGGLLSEDELIIPTNDGSKILKTGSLCDNEPAKIQAFVYKTSGNKYIQQKIEHSHEYILSPYSDVPPGDCIIIEFAPEKEITSNLCETYKVAIEKGEIEGEG